MAKRKFEFRYRLTSKSSLAVVTKAVRALGFEMKVKFNHYHFDWERQDLETGKTIYECREMQDIQVIDFLNEKLEEFGLLAPEEPQV